MTDTRSDKTRTDFINRIRRSRQRKSRPADREQPVDSFWSDLSKVFLWDTVGPFLPLPLFLLAGGLFLLGVAPGLLIALIGVALVWSAFSLRDFFF